MHRIQWAKWPLCLFLLFFTMKAHALFEVDFDFMYTRQIYGSERQNKLTNRTYAGTLAVYLFLTTALEVNYSQNEQITFEHNNAAINGTTYVVSSVRNDVTTDVYGVGIRQALLPPRFRLRPMIATGYARRFTRDTTEYTFTNTATNDTTTYSEGPYKRRDDSVYATFMLQLRLSQMLSLKGSVRTVFPAFDTSKARDYIEYSAGLAWFF